MKWEKVHTVEDIFDIPRAGMADYRGHPYMFECEFDDSNDSFTEIFRLIPVESQLFNLVLERWEMWKRWRSAFDQRSTTRGTHPVLSEDRAQYLELSEQIRTSVDNRSKMQIRKRGLFHRTDAGTYEVSWIDEL